MATRSPAISYAELAAALLSSSEVAPRARLVAEQAAQFVPGGAVVVYTVDEAGLWVPRATEGEVAFTDAVIEFDFGTLGIMGSKREAVLLAGSELAREAYAHLNIRRTLVSLAAIPLLIDDHLVGGIELLSFTAPIAPGVPAELGNLARLAAMGLAAGMVYETERNTSLESISRVTQLYDLEKVFNSTLEMDELLPIITSKFRELLDTQTVNLWLVQGDSLLLASQAGTDLTAKTGATLKAGEGAVFEVSESGEAVAINEPGDERLAKRNAGLEEGTEGAAFSLMAAPVMYGGALVGVAEAVNRMDGEPFDEDDLFLLQNITEAAGGALHNASLLLAERKVEILETLVQISREITATLNLERVMQAIVTGPSSVIPYERACIALEQSGKLQLKAISSMPEINPADPDVKRLDELLRWASVSGQEVYVVQRDGEVEDPRPETREKFKRYFAESGARAFYCLPLSDEQGRVGLLAFESSDPDFLSTAHLEMIKVLGSQATVALRNAQLYKEVPFIGVLEPVLEKKRKFMAMEKRRRSTILALAAAAVLFLVAVPLPMRLDGTATVAPARMAKIQPEVEGVVRKVYVREGDPVKQGTILADLEDWDYRAALAGAQAKQEEAVARMNRALASNDGTEAGIQRVQADYWTSEVTRAQERLERTHLRSPLDGVVATPQVENLVGRRLSYGDTFAEVTDTSRATVDVAIDEGDVPLLEPGWPAAVKLDGYPTHTFMGRVNVISPQGQVEEDHRVFFARISVLNSDPNAVMRPGMQGRGKVDARPVVDARGRVWYPAGWRPAGYVLFRRTGLWVREKLWSWFGI